MRKLNQVVAALVFIAFANSAQAATSNKPSDVANPCYSSVITPIYTKTLALNSPSALAIVASTSYYVSPCYRATVDFTIAPTSGNQQLFPYEQFYFSSLTNEVIGKADCETYHQGTEIFEQDQNGHWALKDKGSLVGSWSGGKCHFHPPAGQPDFRVKKYSPANTLTHYRVMSAVTTGKGIVFSPYTRPGTVPAALGAALASPRQLCIAVERQHMNNTPVVGCADPAQ
jgi:hypothetical protein